MYDSYGLWVFSRFHGSYCFLPFGYGWSSPYGYFYPRDIWYYNLPPVIYNPSPPINTTPTVGAVGGAGATVSDKIRNSRSNREGEPVRIHAPYQRVQKDIGQYPAERQYPAESQGDVFSPPGISPRVRNSSAPSSSSSAPPPSAPILISPSTTLPRKGGN